MGFYPQPNDFTCGPFALKHALVALGRPADESAVTRAAEPHWWAGTDEVKLARAARAFDCELPFIRRCDPDGAYDALVRYTSKRLPVLLCVDDWEHWVTVVRHEDSRFVILDSRHEPVVNVVGWPQLRTRWRYTGWEYDEYDPPTWFDLHPVKPRSRTAGAPAKFSVERAQFLRRPENHDLARHWDDYLEDLLEICRRPSSRVRSLSMGQFLRRHQDMLTRQLCYWHGYLDKGSVLRLLRNFRFVADTYGLVVPAAATRRALTDMSMLLAFWAASAHGVGDMYGSEDANGKGRSLCQQPRRWARSRGRRRATAW